MPGWANIPVSAGGDMTLRATYLELMGAWNECRQMIGDATVTDPAAGDPCFDTTKDYAIKAMQEWVEANCIFFVVSHDAGSPPTLRADGYYHNKPTLDFYTLATLRSTAGINASGFRKTATPTYGIAAIGDDVLIEHFNELRLAFNVLAWTRSVGAWDAHGENNQRVVFSGSFASWNAAYADAVTLWAGAGATGAGPGTLAICHGTFDGVSLYGCGLERVYGYGEFTSIPTFTSHEMDVYLYTAISDYDEANGTFSDHGDTVFQDRFALFQTFGSATTAARTTGMMGQITTVPLQGPAPTATSFAPFSWKNRVASGSETVPQGVIRWDKTYS